MVIVRENGNAMHGMQTREETLEGEKEIAGGIFAEELENQGKREQ